MKDYLSEAGNIHLSYYLEAADTLNIKYEVLVHRLLARFKYNNKHWFITNTVTPLVNSPSKTIASRKNLTNLVLSKSNIPVPKQETLYTVDDAFRFFQESKKIVLKPKQNLGGKGISILPENDDEVRSAFEYAEKNDKSKTKGSVLGEEYVSGENYRLLTLEDKVVGVVKRMGAQITGNGRDDLKTLINAENLRRKANSLIPIDKETDKILKKQGLTMKSIPLNDQKVAVRNNTNLTTGGTTEEYSAYMHPFYADLAMKTLKALNIKFGGVDLITEDITKPSKCAINEVNYNPGLRIHYQVDKGEKINVAIPIMQYIIDHHI
jgi:D-alanine-D-alanine ligase-like ATP-grasp enzyme